MLEKGPGTMGPVHRLIQKAFTDLAEPFQSWEAFWYAISNGIRVFIKPGSQICWPYLLSSLLIAWIIFRSTKAIHGHQSFFEFIFPHDIYRHPSAIADYKYAAFELSTRWLFTAPLISLISFGIYKGLHSVLPSASGQWITHAFARGILASIASIVLADLGLFAAHYLMHRIPLLWQFHQLHHSAKVLTPLTLYRVHPVEALVGGIATAVVGAVIGIFYDHMSGHETDVLAIFGVNALVLLFYMWGNLLRHSHVWVSYGPLMSRLLISPAQHQIHHSVDPKHLDKNFGQIFALWDWVSKTLYIPRNRETLQFGVPGLDPRTFSTLPRMYGIPFVKASRLLAATVGRLCSGEGRAGNSDQETSETKRASSKNGFQLKL